MRFILTTVLLLSLIVQATDIKLQNTISRIRDESSLQDRHQETVHRALFLKNISLLVEIDINN